MNLVVMACLFALALLPLASGASLLQPLSVERPDEEVFPLPSAPRHLPPYGTEVVGPKSTNKFWANWVVEEGRQLSIHPMPYVLRYDSSTGTPNMQVSRSSSPHVQYGDSETNGAEKIRYYFSPFVNEFGLAAVEGASNEDQIIVKEGLFGVHAEVRGLPGTRRRILFPIYSGMSYVSGYYEGFTPRISSDRALLVIESVSDGIWRLLNNGGKEFRLYAIDSSGNFVDDSFEFHPDGTMNKPFEGWIRLAEAQTPDDRAILDQHAQAILVDWQLDGEQGGSVRYTFTKHAAVPTTLLHFAYASHEKLMTGNAQTMSQLQPLAAPTKGRMKAVVGDTWLLQVNQSEAESLSFLPANEPQSSKVTDLKEKAFGTLQFFLHSDQWRQTMFKGSYYFSGKGFQKVAYTCLLLEKFYGLTHSHTQSCADILRRGFQCLYAPTTPECNGAPIGLYYDVAWHGVASREGFSDIGCRNADFGNACYNDHHYHFSYFVVSAAVLVKLKPEFSADHAFVSFVDTLIRDTTNPSSNDAHFPMFRSFDWFDLHSWSRGVIPSADGKDQESTSEELNLLYGVRLWGMVLQRESLQALGTTMLALCASTIREFFLMTQDNQHHPEDFVTNHVTGIFFQNKVDYATWFGWRYEFIHGIQMLPVTPALLMIRTPDFCRQEWDNILSGLPLSETDPWTSLLLAGTLAIIDPEAAYSRLSAMKPEHMDDGLTQLWALYWSASLSTADVPTTGSTITSSTTTSGATEENLALSRFAVASSESSPEHAAAHAVDGLFVTRWSPSLLDENPWISVDLGAVYALSHVVVFWGEFFPSSYLIQGKVTQWTTLAVAAGSSDLLRSNVPQPTFAQLVRIVSQSTGIDIRLWEFQVFLDADVTSTSSSSSSVTTSSMPISTSTTSLGTSPPTTTESGSTTTPFYGPNLALTKPVLASSFRSPTEHAYKAVDGDSNTQWASAPVNQQWLWVDLLGVYAVGQVVVIWGEEYSDFVLQTAPDGIKWTNVATVNGAPDRVGTVFSPAILAQWVRIQCQSACAMREFRIHGEVPESMTTSSTLATSSSSMSPTPSSTTSLQTGEVQSSTTLINSKVNLALLRPVLSSSQRLPTEHVSRMVDGSVDSQWASAETDAMPWAWVDLLGVHEVVEVAVHWGDDYAQVYELQASPNAVDWVSITTDSGSSGQIVQTTLPPNTQTQWIRIVCLSLSGSSCSIRELLVYEAHAAATVASTTGATTAAPVDENVAKEKPVLASSQILPFEHASKAVDGLAGTQWASASSDDQWIWIDLLGSYELDYVLLSWGNTLPSSYNLETSSNGVTWEVAVEDVQPTAPVERTDLPAGTRSQWLRVFCKSTNGCSIQELQVFGTPVSPVRLLREVGPAGKMTKLAYIGGGCALIALLIAGILALRCRPSSDRIDAQELEACMA